VCAASDLDHPNPLADPELVRYAESLAGPPNAPGGHSVVHSVRQTVYLLLPLEQVTAPYVARHLNLSVRTMQRRLDEAGVVFSKLVDDVRGELVVRYMKNPRYPMGRIAGLLGYTRQASFTRWFTGRYGMTPSAWRSANARKTSERS
jgi:AraC-like DNA-binding protein